MVRVLSRVRKKNWLFYFSKKELIIISPRFLLLFSLPRLFFAPPLPPSPSSRLINYSNDEYILYISVTGSKHYGTELSQFRTVIGENRNVGGVDVVHFSGIRVCTRACGEATGFNDIIFIPLPRKFIKICLLPDASKLNINEPSGK